MIGFYVYCGVLVAVFLALLVACVRGAIKDSRRLDRFWQAVEEWDEPPPKAWCREI